MWNCDLKIFVQSQFIWMTLKSSKVSCVHEWPGTHSRLTNIMLKNITRNQKNYIYIQKSCKQTRSFTFKLLSRTLPCSFHVYFLSFLFIMKKSTVTANTRRCMKCWTLKSHWLFFRLGPKLDSCAQWRPLLPLDVCCNDAVQRERLILKL